MCKMCLVMLVFWVSFGEVLCHCGCLSFFVVDCIL